MNTRSEKERDKKRAQLEMMLVAELFSKLSHKDRQAVISLIKDLLSKG